MTAASQFFSKTYDETISLLHATRHYCAVIDPLETASLSPVEQCRARAEAMRVTARLMHVLSWLMAQKAVHAGEITITQAAHEPYSLTIADGCLDASGHDDPAVSTRLRTLLDASRRLYVRVMRLDELVRRAGE